ncbi:Tn3 family transposase [Actinoallomurus acanthiterrae]
MLELGRAQRSIFLARWLRDRDLQRETESGLNVVENYNGVNDYIRSLLTALLSCPSPGQQERRAVLGRGTYGAVGGADRLAAHRRGSNRGSSVPALRGDRRQRCRGRGDQQVPARSGARRREPADLPVLCA